MYIIEKILDFIFPPVCGFCNEINNENLCNGCKKKIDAIKISTIDNYEKDPVYFDEHFYMFKYKKDIRQLILNYKFNEKSYIYKTFAKVIADEELMKNEFIKKYDYIISVPLHKMRFRVRGYNQSELIAREVSKICEKTYCKGVLVKSKNIVAQSKLDKLDRIRNIKDAFEIENDAVEIVSGKKIAIFDDVFTTGATVNECAKVLKSAGASFVGIITLAKA